MKSTRNAKRLALMVWRDICVFALAVAMFAHLYYLWNPSWWTAAWDICWAAAYAVCLAYMLRERSH